MGGEVADGDRVEMFTEAPTAASVHAALVDLVEDDENTTGVERILDELAICMKAATRLGRVVVLGGGWFGHPHSAAWRQMEAVDRDGDEPELPDGFDLYGPVDVDDLARVVAERTGIPFGRVSLVLEVFEDQLIELEVAGKRPRPPAHPLGTEAAVEAELAAHLDVLATLGLDLTLVKAQMSFGAAGRADLVCRDADGGWVVIELKRDAADGNVVDQTKRYLDAVAAGHASDGESVTGLIITDGDTAEFLESVGDDGRITQVNVRALDLPLCRAQRWMITEDGTPAGWLAVAADGRTVVAGGGPAFPEIARLQPFEELPLDWDRYAVWPLPVGDRSTPGQAG